MANYAGNMRMFHFGEIVRSEKGVAGEYALHVQCPWRIERESAIVTGYQDWYRKDADGNLFDPDDDPAHGGSLQEQRLRGLFHCSAEQTRSVVNGTETWFVTDVAAEAQGGCRIVLDGRLAIVLFPCASDGEHWRLFRVHDDSFEHFIVESPE